MSNIFNYISKYGNKTFAEKEFNEVDAAILSQVLYVDFVSVLDNSGVESTLGDALDKFLKTKDLRKFARAWVINKDVIRLCKNLKTSLRFRNILVKNYVYILTQEEQFGALTFILPDKTKIIVYEGTDHNLVGWEEDFAMFYKYPVPSQIDSIKYLKNNVSIFDKKVILLGHSKGGHLAMNAAAFSPWYIRLKINKVYNFDGPGFRLKEINSRKYKMMERKLEYIVPHYSFFGMLLRHNKNAKVIKSSHKGFMAHAVFTWEVRNDRFISEPLSTLSKNLSRSTIMWLELHDDKSREHIVRDVFDYIKGAKVSYITDIAKIKNIITLLRNMDELDDDTRLWLKHFVKYNVDYHFNNRKDNIEIK